MDFTQLISRFTAAAVAGNGAQAAQCFTPDGSYHDCFYGTFSGHAAIADMIENYFHRDAKDFTWDLHHPVSDGQTGYARYVFSYTSRLPGCEGKRALFEGVSICSLRDGLLHQYSEVANSTTGLHSLGFSAERIARFVGNQTNALAARPEAAHHLHLPS